MNNVTLTRLEAQTTDNIGQIDPAYQEIFPKKIRYYVKKNI